MKSKATVAMMEQLVMVLVLALAAALCLQVFVLADHISRTCEAQDHAVLAAQSAAETVKGVAGDCAQAAEHFGGNWDGQAWIISYDASWQQSSEADAAYHVLVVPAESGQDLLGAANITVESMDGDALFQLSVAWQEVA